jgi:hypothetical protein
VRGALVSVLTLAALAAGCGGGGDGDPLSQAEFVAKADAICQKYEAKLDALGQPQNEGELAAFADKAIPIAKDGREELGDLTPPENQQETYDRWLEQGDRAIEVVEDLRDAAKDGDTAEIQRIAQEAEQADQESNRLAAQLGFKECGASPAS